ncbi:MAG: prepilin-type N-terminal cleavage/methylation domain-containing protein [Candidatus Coatesbacteria bacterium]|nr:prepilin-type N-terminal cleavage/methylation domain-containing protein [Candidatus Coatesbacteria bacterium]
MPRSRGSKFGALRSTIGSSNCCFGADCRGFTLVELIVVLFVAGLIAAFVLPSFVGSLRGMRLKGEVKHLAATLRFARSQAVCNKGLSVVRLDLDSGTYELTIKKNGRKRGSSSLGGDLGSDLGGNPGSLGGSPSLFSSGDSLSQSQNFSDSFDSPSGEPKPGGSKGDTPLAQSVKKQQKLKEGISIAGFTYGEETFDDGVCNVFFFPSGASTGGLIELMSESGQSFVIEIEPVTGSVKIKSKDEYE